MRVSLTDISNETLYGAELKGRLLSEKIFLLKDVGISTKIFHFWKAKGLVDFIGKGQWARLNFPEFIWLRILETMRKFGCSIKLMKAVYEELFTKAITDNLAEKNLRSHLERIHDIQNSRELTEEENEILNIVQHYLAHPSLIDSLKNEVSYFSELILDCLKYRTETGIILFEDGTFHTFIETNTSHDSISIKKISISKPHLYIPISSYILEFIEDAEKNSFLIKAGLLSEDEYRVIRELRNKNIRSLTITFNSNDHKIEKIESDENGLINGADAKKIMHMLGLKNYTSIQLNTRDGKSLSFKYTEKKFFK